MDLKTAEDSIWNIAAGISRNGGKVFVYSVGFFAIGRLENLRSEIIHANLPIFIFNAGAYGYDKYGPAHAFYNDDDIKVMRAVGINIISDFSKVHLCYLTALPTSSSRAGVSPFFSTRCYCAAVHCKSISHLGRRKS